MSIGVAIHYRTRLIDFLHYKSTIIHIEESPSFIGDDTG